MSKTYNIQGQSFTLIDNTLDLLNKAAPLLAKLRKLSFEYTKDLDLSVVEAYKARITELTEAKEQIKEILDTGIYNEEPLTDEKRNELDGRLNDIGSKLDELIADFQADTIAQNTINIKNELESYALIELLTDINTLKPILKAILTGGNFSVINWNDADVVGFVKDVVSDFFTVMNRNSLKL